MKVRLSSVLMAAIAAFSCSQDVSAFEDGSYYIKNVESGLFLGGGNNWGTRSTVSDCGDLFTLATVGENAYSILDTYLTSGNKYLGSNLFVDGTNPSGGWTFTAVEGGYTISNGGNYLIPGTVPGTTLDCMVETTADGTDSKAVWTLLTRDEAISELGKASATNPLPATFLVVNPNFNRNTSTGYWNVVNCTNSNLSGGYDHNRCAESYHSKFTISQTLTDVPNGIYKVSAQGFYRQDGSDNTNLPVLFANSESVVFPTIASSADKLTTNYFSGSSYQNGEPNNMVAASGAFSEGLYVMDDVEVVVTDGTLTVGFKNTSNTNIWCIFDNLSIYYYGMDLSVLQSSLDAAVADAEAVTGKMNAAVAAELSAAIAQYKGKSFSTDAEYTTAIGAVNEAVKNAKASLAVYSEIADYNNKAASLDEAGQTVYSASGVETAYEAGTLTESESAAEAYLAAVKAQTTSGSDMSALVNSVWVCEQGKMGTYLGLYTESYKEGNFESGRVLYQTVEGLTNGTYEVRFLAVPNSAWGWSTDGDGIAQIYGNDYTKDITVIKQNSCDPTQYEVALETVVTDGTLEFGFKNVGTGGNWYVAHFVSLKLLTVGVDLSTYVTQLDDALTAAKSVTGTMNGDVASALTDVIAKYDGKTLSSADDYISAISEVKNATAAATESVSEYATAYGYVNMASTLDEAGQASYAANSVVTDVTNAYNNGTLTSLSDEQKTEMSAAYVTAVKSQTTENADFTGAIVNPSFETVNTSNLNEVIGWTVGSSNDTGNRSTSNATYMMSGSDGNYLFNTWMTGLPLSQTIEGLPNGSYRLTATVASDNTNAIFLFANGLHNEGTVTTDKGTGELSSLDFYVYNGTATIGSVGGNGTTYVADGGSWYKVDDFHLTYLSSDVPTPDLGTPKFTGTETGDRLYVTFDDYSGEEATSADYHYVISITINGETYSNTSSADLGAVIEYDFTTSDTYTIEIPVGGIKLLDNEDNVVASMAEAWTESLNLYSDVFTNADFGLGTALTATVRTYAKDMSSGESSGMQSATGWSIPDNGDGRAAGIFEYGSSAYLGGEGYLAPAEGPDGTNGRCLGLVGVWSNTAYYTQTLRLKAGNYMLSVPTYNVGGAAEVTNITGVVTKGNAIYSDVNKFEKGVWTYQFVEFTLAETSLVTVSLGYTAPNAGSSSCPHLFYDRVELYVDDEIADVKLEFARNNALAALSQLSPVGDGLFRYQSSDIEAAKNAILAATTVSEVEAVETPSVVLPEEDKLYQVSLVASGNYMSVNADGVRLSEYAQPLYLKEVSGGYALFNGTEYVAYKGNNTWTITGAENASPFTIIAGDEAYDIKGANGYLGVDDTAEGSYVYGNKDAHKWQISEFETKDYVFDSSLLIESYQCIVAGDITLNVDVQGGGASVVNNGQVKADKVTVNLTVPNSKWCFVEFPCDLPVASLTNSEQGTEWMIARYDGAARAAVNLAQTWVTLSESDVMEGGVGYILQSRREGAENSVFSFVVTDEDAINKIFSGKDMSVTLAENESTYAVNAGWNLVGNPFVAYYNVSALSLTSPITVWDNETYKAVSPVDDHYVLSPLQAFFVQYSGESQLIFANDGRQLTSELNEVTDAKKRAYAAGSRSFCNMVMTDGVYEDYTRVVFNPEADRLYDASCDAAKFMSANADVPQIYTVENGVSYAINERPVEDGQVSLGAYFSHDGEYTIRCESTDSPIVLYDRQTDEMIVMSENGDSYTFYAAAGKTESRFVILSGDESTAVQSVADKKTTEESVYTIQGVKTDSSAKNGLYIVNGKKVRR